MEAKKMIPGRNPVFEYLQTDAKPEALYLSDSAQGKIVDSIIQAAKKKSVKIIKCDNKTLDEMFAGNHQGVILTAKQTSAGIDLKAVAAKNGVIVLLDQITDPHNTGAIIRSAEALGADGVVMQKVNSSGINETVIKTSAGATAYIDVEIVSNIAQFIDRAKDAGFWVIGTSGEAQKNVRELKDTKPAVIVIGAEGSGMRRLTQEKCDFLAKIPLKGKVSSLNASVAAGITLYEFLC